jgi:predicted metal-binding membrane protein
MAELQAAAQSKRLTGEQWLFLLCLLALTALAWLMLLQMARDMSAPGGMADAAMAGMLMPWSLADALLMFAMWLVMMVGMMLPSALPMLLIYQQMLRKRMPTAQRHLALLLFCSAYGLVWAGFALGATALQWALEQLALLSPGMRSSSTALGAGLLLVAGVYQWLPSKAVCLEHCRGPLHFLLGYWRPGVLGGWRMGLAHGAYCLGCCWALMGLLFVVGVMNLLWVAVIGAFVLLEKNLPQGLWLGRLCGLLLLGWSLWLLLG